MILSTGSSTTHISFSFYPSTHTSTSSTSTTHPNTSFKTQISTLFLTYTTTSKIHLHTSDDHNTSTSTSSKATSNPPKNTSQSPLSSPPSPRLPPLAPPNNHDQKRRSRHSLSSQITIPKRRPPTLETLIFINITLKHPNKNAFYSNTLSSTTSTTIPKSSMDKKPFLSCTTKTPRPPHKPQYLLKSLEIWPPLRRLTNNIPSPTITTPFTFITHHYTLRSLSSDTA